MTIANGVITEVRFKGYQRTHGDGWIHYYKNAKVGQEITKETIDKILQYNERANVASVFSS